MNLTSTPRITICHLSTTSVVDAEDFVTSLAWDKYAIGEKYQERVDSYQNSDFLWEEFQQAACKEFNDSTLDIS